MAFVEFPSEFTSFLRTEAENARDTSLDDQRAVAIKAYRGDKYGDEEDGRSQAVTRDVSEVVDFLQTGILGDMLAGGRVVEFESEPEPKTDDQGQPVLGPSQGQGPDGQPIPGKPQMIDYGQEATAAIHYLFMKKGKGYRKLHDCLKAGQLEKTGIIKTYARKLPAVSEQHVLPRAAINTDNPEAPHVDGVPVAGADPTADPDADMAMQAGLMHPAERMHNVTLLHPQAPIVTDEAIPNEWFLVAPDTVELDESIYVGEKTPKTLSQLVEMGYDAEALKEIWGNAPADTVVELARDADRSTNRQSIGQRNNANRQLWLYEEYPLYDLDGDGIAERLFVHRIGNYILTVMPVDEQPYSGWSPFPMPHRFTGQSVFDKTGDIQRIRSVLLRQALDSLYMSNAPRMLLPEEGMTADTIDDLLTVRSGGLIRYRGGQAPSPLAINDASGTAFQAMEMMSTEREGRTGVSRQSQGMNPDTTNKTATGLAMLQANADQIQLYVTRNFAEFIVASIFAKRYRLMRQHTPPFKMKIDGEYVTVDPSRWPDDPDINIRVGLGTGNKDQVIALRGQLLGIQQEIVAAGWPIVGPDEIYNNVSDMINAASLGTPTRYIKDPATVPPQEPKPDPEAEKAQGEAMLKQQALQAEQQHNQAKLALQAEDQHTQAALKQQQTEADLTAKREAAALDTHLKTQKAEFEAQSAVRRQSFEESLAERKFAFDQEMARKQHTQVADDGAHVSSYRPGGDLDQ